ncbi:MAG: YbaK/EbsC family protein [Patescibacteria group bacterium]
MSLSIFEKIKDLLDSAHVEYHTAHHEPTYTSEDAARIRGVALHAGAKSLVVRGSKTKQHVLFVLPADLRLDGKKARAILHESISFATEPEAVTGCVRGSVPPFGSVIGLKTYVDRRLAENDVIHFNAGSLTDSINMKYSDYLVIENPEVVEIVEEIVKSAGNENDF